MLIVAALNLPLTVEFELDSDHNGDAPSITEDQNRNSLLPSAQKEEPEGPEVPFDFAQDHRNATQPPSRAISPMPNKSIVDTRKPLLKNQPMSVNMEISKKKISVPEKKDPLDNGKIVGGIDQAKSELRVPETEVSLHKAAQQSQGKIIGSTGPSSASPDSALPTDSASATSGGASGRDSAPSSASDFPSVPKSPKSPKSPRSADERKDRKARPAHMRASSSAASSKSPASSRSRTRMSRVRSRTLSWSGSTPSFSCRRWDIVPQTGGNGGLYNAIQRAQETGAIQEVKWVGQLGTPTDVLPNTVKLKISEELAEKSCETVYVSDSVRVGHYDNYCKEMLWPTFHCQVPEIPLSKAYEDHSWGDYVAVNKAFADKVVAAYRPGDTIWIHDYHLMLVPMFVRRRLPDAPIGFFMHVSFPTSEVFRCLAYRADLLKGMLASNIIGFQIEEYVQHFMMTAARILAVDTSAGRVETDERDVEIVACAIGVDPERLTKLIREPAVLDHRRKIRARWPTQKLIVARDKVDSTRGLSQKLLAFDRFLAQHPEWVADAVLIQVCLSSVGSDETETDLESIADTINSRYGDLAAGIQPVVLLRQDIVYEQYLALIGEADAFCITALRDGMNLTCHEFVFCNNKEHVGPVILSEFTGSASVFGDDAILINPWDRKQVANAFYEALDMSKEEKTQRWEDLRQYITAHTGSAWVALSVSAITEAWQLDQTLSIAKPDLPKITSYYRNVGKKHRLFFLDAGANSRELRRTGTGEAEFRRSSVGDGDENRDARDARDTRDGARARGLNRPPLAHSSSSYYSSRIAFVLNALLSDPLNIIYVSSPESCAYMDRVYRQLPSVGLIAESGKYVRYAGVESDEWHEVSHSDNNDWQQEIGPLLKSMEERVLLSRVAVHESTIVVEFGKQVTEHGEREITTIGEYVSLINDTFSKNGVRCRLDHNQLIIYTNELSTQRLQAYQKVLSQVPGEIGFMLLANQALATDADDVIYTWCERQKAAGKVDELVTMILGKHPTLAQCMVEGLNALLTLLQTISSK